jgi:hypothetical protein
VQRVDMHRLQELVRLHRMGTGCREASRMLGMSPNTERVYREALQHAALWDGAVDALPELDVLRAAVEHERPSKPPPAQQRSSIESYREIIVPLALRGVGAQAIYDRMRQEHETFTGSLSAVKRLCRAAQRERGVRAEDVAIPIETMPGQDAQVDFGYVGELYDPTEGRLRKAQGVRVRDGAGLLASPVRAYLLRSEGRDVALAPHRGVHLVRWCARSACA